MANRDSSRDERTCTTTKVHDSGIRSTKATAAPLFSGHGSEDDQRLANLAKESSNSIVLDDWNTVFDLVLFEPVVAFLAFALIVNHYNQVSTAKHPRATEQLQKATEYGRTVFPILFATILGRAMHAIPLRRLEKDERIGILDTLASSTSLTVTVVSQSKLRAVIIFGLALVSIWALLPAGGYASIRQLSMGEKVQIQAATFD